MAGEDDDGDVVVDRADLLEQIEARELRHHEIEDDQVKHLVADPLDRERWIGEGRDLEPLTRQEVLEVVADVLVVVDHEHRELRCSS